MGKHEADNSTFTGKDKSNTNVIAGSLFSPIVEVNLDPSFKTMYKCRHMDYACN
jgi:hypothetical protein